MTREAARSWSDEQLQWLHVHYGLFSAKFCGEKLGKSANAVKIMARRLSKESQDIEIAKKP